MGKGKRRVGTQYCERGFEWGNPGMLRPPLHVCEKCHFTAKRRFNNCPTCHAQDSMIFCGDYARPPRKNASKKKWEEFFKYAKRGHNCR